MPNVVPYLDHFSLFKKAEPGSSRRGAGDLVIMARARPAAHQPRCMPCPAATLGASSSTRFPQRKGNFGHLWGILPIPTEFCCFGHSSLVSVQRGCQRRDALGWEHAISPGTLQRNGDGDKGTPLAASFLLLPCGDGDPTGGAPAQPTQPEQAKARACSEVPQATSHPK